MQKNKSNFGQYSSPALQMEVVSQRTISIESSEEIDTMDLKQVINEQNQIATFKSETAAGLSAEIVPSLPGGSSCVTWRQTPLDGLKSILDLARDQDSWKKNLPTRYAICNSML